MTKWKSDIKLKKKKISMFWECSDPLQSLTIQRLCNTTVSYAPSFDWFESTSTSLIRLSQKNCQIMSESSSDADSNSEDEIQIESLVAGRERRTNAGNRMATLLATEEAIDEPENADNDDDDDDLKLLFEEVAEGEDAEFASGDDAVSDVEMDGSTDDEDGKEDDEEAGEKEIERQVKEDKKRKRKALESFGVNKKRKTTDVKAVTVAKSTPISAALGPRPKKKSERVSWLPTQDEGPTRASSRKQTMQNKQVVHERMKEGEKRRVQQLKTMEAAAKRKEKERSSKALTQEDRLAEAASVEERNATTLNRWEATERKRVEEQRVKLASLKNRGLQGAVMTIWSGPSQWVDGKCIGIVRKIAGGEVEKDEDEEDTTTKAKSKPGPRRTGTPPRVALESESISLPVTMSSMTILQNPDGSWDTSAPENPLQVPIGRTHRVERQVAVARSTSLTNSHDIRIESRTLIGLDASALVEPSMQDSVLLKARKSGIKIHGKMPEKEKCLITGIYARYRDPKTGVPYANMTAFKQLRMNDSVGRYTNGRWSTLLGQYVGSDLDTPAAVPSVLKRIA